MNTPPLTEAAIEKRLFNSLKMVLLPHDTCCEHDAEAYKSGSWHA